MTDLAKLTRLADEVPVVVGYRADRKDPWRRRFLSWGYNRLARTLLGTRVRDVDCARGLLYVAATRPSETQPTAMAKAYAAEACLDVARRGHQIFGAISYCEEHSMHLLHKRIHAASVDYGDAGTHLETVARAIGLGD